MTLRWKIEEQKEQTRVQEHWDSLFNPGPVTPDWCQFFWQGEEEEGVKEPVVENFVASNWKYEWDSDEEIRLEKSYMDDDLQHPVEEVADCTLDMVDTKVDMQVDTSMTKKVGSSINTPKHVDTSKIYFSQKEVALQKKIAKYRKRRQKFLTKKENHDIAMKWSRQTSMEHARILEVHENGGLALHSVWRFFWHCRLFPQR